MKYYKAALIKAYFDEGYGFTSYIKYLVALIGGGYAIIENDFKVAVIAGGVYGIFCFFAGWLIFKTKFKDAQIEVHNRVDPFVREMRKVYK